MNTFLHQIYGKFLRLCVQPLLHLLFPEREQEKTVADFTLADFADLPSPTSQLPGIVSLFSYKDPRVQALIWELKYHRNSRAIGLVAQALAERIVKEVERETEREIGDAKDSENGLETFSFILTTIPLTPERLRERTYSQTDLLCREIVKIMPTLSPSPDLNLTYNPTIARKIRHTDRQNKTANRGERLTNLQGAFEASTIAANTHIILIDDVTTTGATLYELSRTLKTAGAREIIAFTLAH